VPVADVHRVVDRALQICGALDVSGDTPQQRLYREVCPFRIYDGPSETHRWSVRERRRAGRPVLCRVLCGGYGAPKRPGRGGSLRHSAGRCPGGRSTRPPYEQVGRTSPTSTTSAAGRGASHAVRPPGGVASPRHATAISPGYVGTDMTRWARETLAREAMSPRGRRRRTRARGHPALRPRCRTEHRAHSRGEQIWRA
jgi:hypothetical protein